MVIDTSRGVVSASDERRRHRSTPMRRGVGQGVEAPGQLGRRLLVDGLDEDRAALVDCLFGQGKRFLGHGSHIDRRRFVWQRIDIRRYPRGPMSRVHLALNELRTVEPGADTACCSVTPEADVAKCC